MTSEELQNERKQALGKTINHCPFGCPDESLEANGYCPHLVGFTNDGKVMDTVQDQLFHGQQTGLKIVSGNKKLGHLQDVLPTDKLINPIKRQKDDAGIWGETPTWVSSRVYRQTKSTVSTREEESPRPPEKKKPVISEEERKRRSERMKELLAKKRAEKQKQLEPAMT